MYLNRIKVNSYVWNGTFFEYRVVENMWLKYIISTIGIVELFHSSYYSFVHPNAHYIRLKTNKYN